MEYAVFRVEKIKTRAALGTRAAHNLRANPKAAPHADPNRRSLNRTVGAKTVEGVQAALDKRLGSLAKPPRSNAVLAVELMLTASPEWFAAGGDLKAWSTAANQWVQREFGAENILTLSLHRDETTPHIQVLLVPIHEGKLRASHWCDGPKKLSELQTRYHKSVAALGLRRGEKRDKPSRHTSLAEFYRLTKQILAAAKKGGPKGPDLPQRGILGQVDREDWTQLEKALEAQNDTLAKLHAEAAAGRIFISSSTGVEMARRQDELAKRERALKAEEERVKKRAATVERLVDERRAEHAQLVDQVVSRQAEVTKLDAEIEARRQALKVGILEDYRDQLKTEVLALRNELGWKPLS